MANAVLVIDMLRGFLEAGYPLCCGERARRIISPITKLLKQETSRGSRVFFVCDSHDPDDLEFRMFPPHCVAGTTEAEVIPELSEFPGEIGTHRESARRESHSFHRQRGDEIEIRPRP
jgi:nicotinamidase/pyrazinamidase